MDKISGQLFFRDMGEAADGRRLYLIVGLVAFPESVPIKDEHQYTVMGAHYPGYLSFTMPEAYAVYPGVKSGATPDDLVTSPIWQV